MADVLSPKTPAKIERIPRDDSFKTCRATLHSPETRRQLRMTPVRTSILSGGKPFKEAPSSGKKFNTRSRIRTNVSANVSQRQHNDTAGSNDTFIRCEQDPMFDRDSLEVATQRYSSTPKHLTSMAAKMQICVEELHIDNSDDSNQNYNVVKSQSNESKTDQSSTAKKLQSPLSKPAAANNDKIAPIETQEDEKADKTRPVLEQSLSKQPTFLKEKIPQTNNNKFVDDCRKLSNTKTITDGVARPVTRRSPKKFKSPKKRSPKKNLMPPPPPIVPGSEIRRKFTTPRMNYKKPASLMGTASRYLSQCNTSRISRTTSFKSTAEMERDYFNSLRSF